MIGEDFLFNGESLSDFSMKMYDPEEDIQFIGKDIDRSEITSLRPIPNHYSSHYNDTMKIPFLIIRNEELCSSQKDYILSETDINTLRSWLESPQDPEQLAVKTDNNVSTYYFGIFTDIQPFLVSKVCYGLYLTFTCNAPYGFSDLYKNTYTINASSSTISGTFSNTSSEQNAFLYPIVTIYSKSTFKGESLSITNKTDNNNVMTLKLPSGLSSLVIDCSKKLIADNNGNLVSMSDVGLTVPSSDNYSFISAESYFFYWLRFKTGKNDLSFKGSSGNTISKVEVTGRYIVKSGGI